MSGEDNFKDLLNEKLGSKEFPFNAENWDKARKMIDASHNRRRGIFLIVFSCLLVFVTGVAFVIFSGDATTKKSETQAIKSNSYPGNEQTQSASELHPSESVNKPAEKSPTIAEAVAEKTNAYNSGINENQNSSTSTLERPQVEKRSDKLAVSDKSGSTETKASQVTDKFLAPAAKLNEARSSASLKKKPKNVTKQAPSSEYSSEERSSVALRKKQKKNTEAMAESAVTVSKQADDKQKQIENGKKEPAIVPSVTPEISQDADVDITLSRKKTVKDEVVNQVAPAAKKEVVSPVEDGVNPVAKEAKEELLPIEPTAPVTATPITMPDPPKVNELVVVEDTIQEEKISFPKNIFSIEAGSNYHLGWSNVNGEDANGFNPILGVNYTRVFSTHLSLSLGAHYTTVGNLGSYRHESADAKYSFGRERTQTIITPVKIHYVIAPLRFSYAFNSKNTVGVGYTFGYLLTVNNKVENYSQRLNQNSNETTSTVSKTKGYADGFNPVDSQMSLFYRRKIYRDLSVNGEFFFGLMDVKENSFFSTNSVERNSGMKITLIYNLFKK